MVVDDVAAADDDGEDAQVSVTLTLGDLGEVSWETVWSLVDVEGEGWRVVWERGGAAPRPARGWVAVPGEDVARPGTDPRHRRPAVHRRGGDRPRRHRAAPVRSRGVDPDPGRGSRPRSDRHRVGARCARRAAGPLRADRRAPARRLRGGQGRHLPDPWRAVPAGASTRRTHGRLRPPPGRALRRGDRRTARRPRLALRGRRPRRPRRARGPRSSGSWPGSPRWRSESSMARARPWRSSARSRPPSPSPS